MTVYPKNQTDSPDLEKPVREDKNSTGKNTGSLTDIADGYAPVSYTHLDVYKRQGLCCLQGLYLQ